MRGWSQWILVLITARLRTSSTRLASPLSCRISSFFAVLFYFALDAVCDALVTTI